MNLTPYFDAPPPSHAVQALVSLVARSRVASRGTSRDCGGASMSRVCFFHPSRASPHDITFKIFNNFLLILAIPNQWNFPISVVFAPNTDGDLVIKFRKHSTDEYPLFTNTVQVTICVDKSIHHTVFVLADQTVPGFPAIIGRRNRASDCAR